MKDHAVLRLFGLCFSQRSSSTFMAYLKSQPAGMLRFFIFLTSLLYASSALARVTPSLGFLNDSMPLSRNCIA